MDIEIRCYSCAKPLRILNEALVPGMNTLRLEVAPCKSKGCTNCVDCEDMKLLKQIQEELKMLKEKTVRGNPFEAIP